MYFLKIQKDNGSCVAINRDKIVAIHVFSSENGCSGTSDILMVVETDTEIDESCFTIFKNFPCAKHLPYLCQCLFDEITSYGDNVHIIFENLKSYLNKKIVELGEKEYNSFLNKMADTDLSSTKLDFENGVRFPFPSDDCEDASEMLKAENCDVEAAMDCVRAARGEKDV